MVNRVILIGNLGKDPEIRHLDNGAAVAKFTLATNESYRDKDGQWQTLTEWHDIVAWRQLAERAAASLKKGMTLYVEGKLSTRTWQDQDGNARRTTEVVANYFRILTRRDELASTGPAMPMTEAGAPPPDANDIHSHTTTDDIAGRMMAEAAEAPQDDLPF